MEYVSFGRFVTMIHCRGGQGKSRELRSLQKHAQTFCVDVVFFFLKQSVEVVFPKTLCFVNPCGATSESGVGGKNSFELQAMRIMLQIVKDQGCSGSIPEEQFLPRYMQIPVFSVRNHSSSLKLTACKRDARKRFEAGSRRNLHLWNYCSVRLRMCRRRGVVTRR